MSWNNLKTGVNAIVKTNGNQGITGANMQNVLGTIIDNLGANATFVGIATPSTVPGTPDGPVFYLASQHGRYSNFGNIDFSDGEIGIFIWNTNWTFFSLDLNLSQISKSLGLQIEPGESDFDIADESGNVILKLSEGNIRTKNFNSEDVNTDILAIKGKTEHVFLRDGVFGIDTDARIVGTLEAMELSADTIYLDDIDLGHKLAQIEDSIPDVVISSVQNADFSIADDNGNVIVKFANGGIKTKNFDSESIGSRFQDFPGCDFGVADENGNLLFYIKNGNFKTKNFDSTASSGGDASSILKNKKICFMGDSYMAGNGTNPNKIWPYLLASKWSMDYTNLGQNGAPIIGSIVSQLSNVPLDCDYLVIEGGKNDYNRQYDLNTFADTVDNLIVNAVNLMIPNGCRLCFMTPWRVYQTDSDDPYAIKLRQYCEIIEEKCDKYALPCYKSYKDSGVMPWNAAFRSKFLQNSADVSHFNEAGHEWFLNKIEKFISNL